MNGEQDYPSVADVGTVGGSGNGNASGEIDYLRLALKYKSLIMLGFVAGLLLGAAMYLKLGPAYEATARILVSKKASVPIKEGEATTYGERGEHIALIMSPMIVGKAVEKHRLNELPSLVGSKDPVEDILDSLVVKRSAGHDQSFLNIIDLWYRNPLKEDANAVMSAIIDAYRSYVTETTEAHADEVVQLISKANTELLQQLRQKEKEYLEFRENAPLHWRKPPGAESTAADVTNIHQQNLEAVEAERRANLLRRTELTSKIKSLEEAYSSGQSRESLELLARLLMTTGTRTGTASPAPPASESGIENRLLPLLMEEKNLLRDFGPDHPKVLAVQKSIETVRNFYRSRGIVVPEVGPDGTLAAQPRANATAQGPDFFGVYMQSLRQQLSELDHRETELAKLEEREAKLAKAFARYHAQDQTFNDDIQRIKSLWDVVVRRLDELNLVKHNQGYSLKEIAPVRVELLLKRIIKFLGAGLVASFGLVLGLIFFREWRDTTLKTVDEIRNAVRKPVFGAVPRFAIDDSELMAGTDSVPLVGALCYYHRPGSVEAEAYRSIRTTLLSHAAQTGDAVFQVSSPEPSDGKTTFVSNLALALAQAGKNVLLIDADLRRPRVHSLFGVGREIGLVEVADGEIDFANAVKPTAVKNLSLLTAGASVPNPAELLASPQLGALISAARQDYEFVLVDAPPVLAVSDACVVAQHTDGLLLVLQVGKNGRAAVKRSIERLETNNVRVVGAIANSIEVTSEDGYGYGYGYGLNYLDEGARPSSAERASTTANSETQKTLVNLAKD